MHFSIIEFSVGYKGPGYKEVYIDLAMTLIDDPKSNMHLSIIEFLIVHGIVKISGSVCFVGSLL